MDADGAFGAVHVNAEGAGGQGDGIGVGHQTQGGFLAGEDGGNPRAHLLTRQQPDSQDLPAGKQNFFGQPRDVSKGPAGELKGCGHRVRFNIPSGHPIELYAEKDYVGNGLGRLNPDPWPDPVDGAEWLEEPTEETRRAAEAIATANEFNGPFSWIAIAAFWGSGSIAPAGQQAVAAPWYLTARGVVAGLILAATAIPETAHASYSQFIEIGHEQLAERVA